LLPRLIYYQDEPLADSAIIPCYLIAQQAASRVKVILNGTGGDELFGGYPRYNLRALVPGRFSAPVGRAAAALGGSGAVIRKLGAVLDFRARYMRQISVFAEPEIRKALGLTGPAAVAQRIAELFRESGCNDASGAMMYVDLHTYLPGDLFMLLDKMTMAVSLEARVPLLDHRLVEFAAALPGALRMRGRSLKWLLRRALRGQVPDEILDRPKQGFGPPVPQWLEGTLGTDALRLCSGSNARVAELLGPSRVRSWLAGDQAPAIRAWRLWTLLVLELWWRVFVDGEDLSAIDVPGLAESEYATAPSTRARRRADHNGEAQGSNLNAFLSGPGSERRGRNRPSAREGLCQA
jgi:asparagine synthase (glutamine-hydrolysing)